MISIAFLFILISITMLVCGIRKKNAAILIALNGFWFLGSLGSAYLTWLVWEDRGYSENWAMIGFIFFALPYIILVGLMLVALLFLIRRWQDSKTKILRLISIFLLIFLVAQLIVGFAFS